jgi:CheY-like chemotaxis protein/anti-sigma regulatory factor (Ser/Thr protein kinase)
MKRALIVEDVAPQADVAAAILRDLGFRVTRARDGETALTLARLLRPDILLLSLTLPDADGFDLCRRLRTDPRTTTTPIVLLTDLENSTERRRGFRVGGNAYLSKPYGPDELRESVESALAWRDGLARSRMQGEIRVELNSEDEFLADVNEFLTELCRRTPLTVEQVQHLRQAFMEMGMNAIEWGNRRRAEKLVAITYRVYGDRIEIVVSDEGTGFDPNDLPHAASPEDPLTHLDVREQLGLREGGFGLLIARGMLDELRYNDRGNEVTLIQRFAPVPFPDPEARADAETAREAGARSIRGPAAR